MVALEFNMRPCGGFTPDMINFAYSTNMYKTWANMIVFDHSDRPEGDHHYCAFMERCDEKDHKIKHDELIRMYLDQMKMVERIPDVFSGAMATKFPSSHK